MTLLEISVSQCKIMAGKLRTCATCLNHSKRVDEYETNHLNLLVLHGMSMKFKQLTQSPKTCFNSY